MFGPMILVALPELMQEPSPATKGESNDGGGRSEKGVTGGSESFLTYDNAEVVQNILYHEFKIEVSNFIRVTYRLYGCVLSIYSLIHLC